MTPNPYIEEGWVARMLPPEGARVQWLDSDGNRRTGVVYTGRATLGVIRDANQYRQPGALCHVDVTTIEPEERS